MRTLLFIMLVVTGVTAIVTGILLLTRPEGEIQGYLIDVLRPASANSLIVPGVLLTLSGMLYTAAVFGAMQQNRSRYNWALAAGIISVVLMAIDMIFTQTVHWLQFLYLVAGFLIVLLAYQLKGKWAA